MRVNAYDFPGHNHATVFDGVQFGQNEWQFVDLCRSHLMVKRCGQNQTSNKKKWVCQWFVYYHILAWSMSSKKGVVSTTDETQQSNQIINHLTLWLTAPTASAVHRLTSSTAGGQVTLELILIFEDVNKTIVKLSLSLCLSLVTVKLFQDIFNFDANDCTPLVNQVMLCRIGLPAQHPWQPFNWGELFSHSSLLMNSKWTVFRWNIDIFKMKIKVL